MPKEVREFVPKFCQDSRFWDQDLGLAKYAAGRLFVYRQFEWDPNLVPESQPHIIPLHFAVEDVIRVIVSKYTFASKHSAIHADGTVDIHTYIHTYIHPYIYTYTYTHTYIHTYIHPYIYTYIHTHIHIHIHIYIHTYTHTYMHTYIHTYIHTHIHTYIHTYIHYIHTHIHTYIHT